MKYKIGDKVKLLRESIRWNSSAGGKSPNNVNGNDLGIKEPFIGIINNIWGNVAIVINGYGFSTTNSKIDLLENTYEIY